MKLAAWEAAQKVDNYDPKMFRKDACGAWIVWAKYNQQDSIYGWEVDHIYPQSKLEGRGYTEQQINAAANLRALQHQNNASKGDDYPIYMAVVSSEENKNVEQRRSLEVNQEKQKELENLYHLQ